jgi:hypothetical protein
MAILPLESVEMIYREMAKGLDRRSPLLKTCQELLLLISKIFPILLTHPGTIDALYLNLTRTDDPTNTTNALQVLAALKDPKSMHINKKTATSEKTTTHAQHHKRQS